MKSNSIILCISSLLISGFAVLFALPSWSLPGWKADFIRQWVKNHPFLAPKVEEFHGPGITGLSAGRQIEGGGAVKIFFYIDSIAKKNIVEIYLEGQNIWSRDNKTAYILLHKIYNSSTADDFKQSIFVFQSVEYVPSGTDVMRSKIESHELDREILPWSDVKFFKGKKFLYEVVDSPHEDSAQWLKISFLDQNKLNRDIDILKHNTKMYALFKQRQERHKPAKLE